MIQSTQIVWHMVKLPLELKTCSQIYLQVENSLLISAVYWSIVYYGQQHKRTFLKILSDLIASIY